MAQNDQTATNQRPPEGAGGGGDDVSNQEPLDGGSVSGADREVPFQESKFHAETARKLSILLISILAVSVAVHYLLSALFSQWGNTQVVATLAGIFDVWLPVISGFVGSAITYYYTRDK